MKILRSLLLEALKAVQPGLDGAARIEQSDTFVFTKDGKVFTYNDEIAVSHPINVDFTGAVPAKEFYGLVSKIKSEEFELKLTEGELFVKGGKAKSGLRLIDKITLPIEELGLPDKWTKLPEKFNKAVQFCLFSASKDESKAVLTCIHVIGDMVESCDNYRITQYDMGKGSAKAFPEELLIPASSAKDIVQKNPIEYAVTEGWLHFRNKEDVTYSCRYFYDTEYPDFTPFLECEGSEVEFPETLSDILGRADVLSDGERVSIILEKDELVVATENENGWFEESVKVKYNGEPAEFDIQPVFMKSILKFNGIAIVSENALRFDSENFVHVVQLLPKKQKNKRE